MLLIASTIYLDLGGTKEDSSVAVAKNLFKASQCMIKQFARSLRLWRSSFVPFDKSFFNVMIYFLDC